MPVPTLLAVDVGGLIAIAFMVISFIGWLSNLINGTQKPGQRPAQPQRPRPPQNRRLRDEIEAFMREAQGQPKPQPPKAEVLAAEDVMLGPGGQRTSSKKPKGPKPARKPAPPAAASVRSAPGQEVARRQVETSALGQSVQQHVSQHMVERVAAIASRDVEPTVDDSVAAHFSPFSGDSTTAGGKAPGARSVAPAAELLKLLRTSQGVRQAFVLGEILNPPVSLRRHRPHSI